jgi:hypothetical protein
VFPNAIGNLELVAVVQNGVRVAGWTLDPDAPWIANHVLVAVDGAVSDAGAASLRRDDVEAAYPGVTPFHGYDVVVRATLTPGTHTVCAYGANVPGSNGFAAVPLGCKAVTR